MDRDARVDALYHRVVRGVCDGFKEHAAQDDEANTSEDSLIALMQQLEQLWLARLAFYTGRTIGESANESCGSVVDEPVDIDASASGTVENETVDPPIDPHVSTGGLGQPHSLSLSSGPSVAFASMLLNKRKIDQVDGSVEDEDSDSVRAQADDEQPANVSLNTLQDRGSQLATYASISTFPLQCSARDVKFGYKRKMLQGTWKSAIVTLVRPLRQQEPVIEGHLLWLWQTNETDAQGSVVEVLADTECQGDLLSVRTTASSADRRVHRSNVARFYECIVAECRVRFQFLTKGTAT